MDGDFAIHFAEWESLLDEANIQACLDITHLFMMKQDIKDTRGTS